MDRKKFIQTCGLACTSGAIFTALLESCSGTKMISGHIVGSDLVIQLSEFKSLKGNKEIFKPYLVIHSDPLQFPVCVYRHSENDFSALWMRCTHQGAELQAFGDKLVCPAHGSEFTSWGTVQNGPADTALRRFPVIKENDQLKISLKQQ